MLKRKRIKAGSYRLLDSHSTIVCIEKTGVDGRDDYPWEFFFPHHPAIRGGVAASLTSAEDIAQARWAARPMGNDDGHTCPRCKGGIPSDTFRGQYPGALSRLDNSTYICSSCGMNEAMWQHATGQPLPPLDEIVSNWPDVAATRYAPA
jgi:hypothetical protein